MPFRLLLPACLLLLLAACARQPLREVEDFQRYRQELAAIEDWQLSGKMNLRVPGESDTVRIIWQNRPEDFAIRLSGALGMGATWIRGNSREVRLEQSGGDPIIAPSADELAYSLLGRSIPISELRYWIRGLPAPQPRPAQLAFNAEGVLTQLEQSGWTLQFSDYRAVGDWNLPGRIVGSRDDMRITLLISDWSLAAPDEDH